MSVGRPTEEDNLTPKQEAFALAYLETGNAAEAYRRAYDVAPDARDSWLYVEACQLLDNPKIARRVEALQAEAARLALYNVTAAFSEYEEARLLAMKAENPSAAVGAVKGKVALFGLETPARFWHQMTGKDGGPIKTEETGAGSAKLTAYLDAISSRTTGDPSAG